MSVVGIIAEYNPFHNGHKYQIEKIKSLTGCDDIIVVMSGNYVQRGLPAAFPKYDRGKLAIENGASMVIEMPVIASTSSAEAFAHSGISLLNSLGIVDYICFGAETDNLQTLTNISMLLADEPVSYQNKLKEHLSEGKSFPVAREMAIKEQFVDSENISSILSSPNNILAIEYLKALSKTRSSIKPIIVKREDKGYNSLDIDNTFASATAIRAQLGNNCFTQLRNVVPQSVYNYLLNNPALTDINLFSDMLYHKLISCENFNNFYDISNDLGNRIKQLTPQFSDYKSFFDCLHTRNNTDSHNSRALTHILLNIPNEAKLWIDNESNYYIHILAINSQNMYLLNMIKESSSIPIINKFGGFYNQLPDTSPTKRIIDINNFADNLFNYVYYKHTGKRLKNDFHINFADIII